MTSYDGYEGYGVDEATHYEAERKKEFLWWQEETFVSDYFQSHRPRTLLDAPVGTGRFLERYGNVPEVVGVDISEAMLAQSYRKLADPRLAQVKLRRGDIFKLEFSDNYFELTVCWRFAHLVPANMLADALRELGRVTSGEILLQAYVGRSYWWRLAMSLRRLPASISRRFSGTTRPPLPWAHIRAYFHTNETLVSKIASAGLTINRRVQIGTYDDSVVYVYQLGKSIAR